jgi:hypothetical protein
VASSLGCSTLPAVVDLVVPSPVVGVAVKRDPERGVVWRATYGKVPQQLAGYPNHRWLERNGAVEVPGKLAACDPFVARPEGSFEPIAGPDRWTLLYDTGRAALSSGPSEALRAALPDEPCVYFLSAPDTAPGALALLDKDGQLVRRIYFPDDVPPLDPRRWRSVLVAVATDVLVFPVWIASWLF